MNHTIEDQGTAHGLHYVVVAAPMGHRCGYVGIPKEHPLYGVDYSNKDPSPEFIFDVHGGLTYSGGGNFPIESDLWWFGFDCAHYDDAKDPSIMSEEYVLYTKHYMGDFAMDGSIKDTEYVKEECIQLAKQLAEYTGRISNEQ